MSTPFAYPASVQQQGLYRLHLRHPGLVAYNLGIEQVLVGPVDAGVLERVFNEMVRRHESLRTGFTLRDDAVMQLVAPSAEVPLALTDLSGLPAGEREPALRTLQLDDARTPFDLERGPLLRTRLVRLGPDRHVLVLVINHLVFDAHSMFLVLREFSQLYPAFLAGRPSPLPPLRIQYVDFCAWQARRLAGAAVTRQLDYWRRQLPGSPGLRLPVDRPWPDELSLEGGRLPVELPPGLTTSIRSVARQEGATPYMVVLACYQALLREITGQDDVTVRSPVVGRDRPELEHLIGFFVNRVVMRTDLSGDPTFRQLLARVKAVVLAAFANQDVPFEKLLQELPPAPPGPPPFQVGLNLIPGHGGWRPDTELPFSVESGEQYDNGTAKFPLTLELTAQEERMVGVLEYSSDIFEVTTVEAIGERLLELVRRAVADPGRRLSELDTSEPGTREAGTHA